MINELQRVAHSLEQNGIHIAKKHPSILKPARQPAFVIGLSEDGQVKTVSQRTADQVASGWKQGKGNHGHFPILSTKAAWSVDGSDPLWQAVKDCKDPRDKLDLVWDRCVEMSCRPISGWSGLISRVEERLALLTDVEPSFNVLPELLTRFTRIEEMQYSFIAKVAPPAGAWIETYAQGIGNEQ